jgi:hypothetical protein
MRGVFAFLAGVSLACPTVGRADSEKPFPQPGSTVPQSFDARVVNGNWKDAVGKAVDRYQSVVCRFGLRPVVLVFARNPRDQVVFNFLKKLEAKVTEHKDQDLCGAAIFLGPDDKRDDPKAQTKDLLDSIQEGERLAEDVKKRAKDAGLKNVLVGIAGPVQLKAFKVPPTAAVMIVMYRKYRVAESFTLKAGELDKKSGEIMTAVDKLAAPEKKAAPERQRSDE